MDVKFPSLYEINTRVWLNTLNLRLIDVPESYWVNLKELGMDYIWLMGIWKTSENNMEKYAFDSGLVEDYNNSLPDWKNEDVIGSPYAIDSYKPNSNIISENELKIFKEKLNKIGLKLILDFIPNHFSAESSLKEIKPEIFLQAQQKNIEVDNYTYFNDEKSGIIFAHGRDPFFPAWQDTLQINYFSEEARQFMSNEMEFISDLCDGVRCDMAMLILNNVFANTWSGVINNGNFVKPEKEYWSDLIPKIKAKNENFIFIAEAYWDLEYNLQELGFDYTYDKKLTDRLKYDNVEFIKSHLRAEKSFQFKSVRFIENHDEKRAVSEFGKLKSMAAATVISTLTGMRFYFDTQFQGCKIKLPVQLGRYPEFNKCELIENYYLRLLKAINNSTFKLGEWDLIEPIPAWHDDNSYRNFLCWSWKSNNDTFLVTINYNEKKSQCRVKSNFQLKGTTIKFTDELTGDIYKYSTQEINGDGLYVQLLGFKSHIFRITEE